MIRRNPPRPRRAVQDFHFFAGTQRPTGIETRQPAPPNSPAPPPADATSNPPSSASLSATQPPVSVAPKSPAATVIASAAIPPPAVQAKSPIPAATLTRKRARAQKPARRKSNRTQSEPRNFWERPEPAPDDRSGAPHHKRCCTVCRHPERDAIDNEFIHWFPSGQIANFYQVSRAAIFRHAHATNLFERRNRNVRFALSHLIECASFVQPTADSIVRAVHAFCRVNDDGHWVEAPTHVIVSSGSGRHVANAAARMPIEISLDANALPVPPAEPSHPLPPETNDPRLPTVATLPAAADKSRDPAAPMVRSTRNTLSSRK